MDNINTMTVATNVMLGLFFLLLVLVTASVSMVPWVADRHAVFGVSVPLSAHTDRRIRGYKAMYACNIVSCGIIALLIDAMIWRNFGMAGALWALFISSLVIAAMGFIAQQRYRRLTLELKKERGWTATGERHAVLVGERGNPQPLGLAWELLHVVAIAVTIAVGVLGYDHMPERVAMHANAAGQIDGWVDKGPMLIWYPVIVQVLLAVVMVAGHAAIIYAKHPIDPDHPATTGYAYGVFSRVWSIYTLVIGLLTAGGIGLGMQLSDVGVIDLGVFGVFAMLVAMVAVVGALVISLYYGQNGSREYAERRSVTIERGGEDAATDGDKSMPYDDDRYWVAGVFYVNRDDPAVMVPKRFGVGWTVNFARPSVIIVSVVLIAVCIGSLVVAVM